MLNIGDPRKRLLDIPRKSLKARTSGVTLWSPGIVMPATVKAATRPPVALGEPQLRPEAVRAHIEATRSVIRSLDEARAALSAHAVSAERRASEADTEPERVGAVLETYRVEGALDDMLRGTLRQITALMEARGLR